MMRVPLPRLTVLVITSPPVLYTANPTLPLITRALVIVRVVPPSELYLVPPAIVSVPLPVIVPAYCRISPWFREMFPLWVPG